MKKLLSLVSFVTLLGQISMAEPIGNVVAAKGNVYIKQFPSIDGAKWVMVDQMIGLALPLYEGSAIKISDWGASAVVRTKDGTAYVFSRFDTIFSADASIIVSERLGAGQPSLFYLASSDRCKKCKPKPCKCLNKLWQSIARPENSFLGGDRHEGFHLRLAAGGRSKAPNGSNSAWALLGSPFNVPLGSDRMETPGRGDLYGDLFGSFPWISQLTPILGGEDVRMATKMGESIFGEYTCSRPRIPYMNLNRETANNQKPVGFSPANLFWMELFESSAYQQESTSTAGANDHKLVNRRFKAHEFAAPGRTAGTGWRFQPDSYAQKEFSYTGFEELAPVSRELLISRLGYLESAE